MKTTKTQAIIWALTLIITGRLVYVAIQHHMPLLDIAAIALLAAYGFKAALENMTAAVRRARAGSTR